MAAIPLQDFTGFWFNGKHSSEFNLIRTSDGSRYNDSLGAEFKDITQTVAGRDGTLFWDSNYTSKKFTINVAFDNLSEEKYHQLRTHFNGKVMGDLIFDELPYKAYKCKLQSPPQWKVLCFDKEIEDRSTSTILHNHQLGTGATADSKTVARVYKGEGTLNFICYEGRARCIRNSIEELIEIDANDYDEANIQETNTEWLTTLEKMTAVYDQNHADSTRQTTITKSLQLASADSVFAYYSYDEIKQKLNSILDEYIDNTTGLGFLDGWLTTKSNWKELKNCYDFWQVSIPNTQARTRPSITFEEWWEGNQRQLLLVSSQGVVQDFGSLASINDEYDNGPNISFTSLINYTTGLTNTPNYKENFIQRVWALLLQDISNAPIIAQTLLPPESQRSHINNKYLFTKCYYDWLLDENTFFTSMLDNWFPTYDTNYAISGANAATTESITGYQPEHIGTTDGLNPPTQIDSLLRALQNLLVMGQTHLATRGYTNGFATAIKNFLIHQFRYGICNLLLNRLDAAYNEWKGYNINEYYDLAWKQDPNTESMEYKKGLRIRQISGVSFDSNSNWYASSTTTWKQWATRPLENLLYVPTVQQPDLDDNVGNPYIDLISVSSILEEFDITNIPYSLQNINLQLNLYDNGTYITTPQLQELIFLMQDNDANPNSVKNRLAQTWQSNIAVLHDYDYSNLIGIFTSSGSLWMQSAIYEDLREISRILKPSWNIEVNLDEWIDSVPFLPVDDTEESVLYPYRFVLNDNIQWENDGRGSGLTPDRYFMTQNAGDFEGYIKLIIPTESLTNASLNLGYYYQIRVIRSDQPIIPIMQLNPIQIQSTSTYGKDIYLCWDNYQRSIYGVYYDSSTRSFQPTGTLYNTFIKFGDFVLMPQGDFCIDTQNDDIPIAYGQLQTYFY